MTGGLKLARTKNTYTGRSDSNRRHAFVSNWSSGGGKNPRLSVVSGACKARKCEIGSDAGFSGAALEESISFALLLNWALIQSFINQLARTRTERLPRSKWQGRQVATAPGDQGGGGGCSWEYMS
eukprot:3020629-Pleurochrysis_carterae.AAC.2